MTVLTYYTLWKVASVFDVELFFYLFRCRPKLKSAWLVKARTPKQRTITQDLQGTLALYVVRLASR